MRHFPHIIIIVHFRQNSGSGFSKQGKVLQVAMRHRLPVSPGYFKCTFRSIVISSRTKPNKQMAFGVVVFRFSEKENHQRATTMTTIILSSPSCSPIELSAVCYFKESFKRFHTVPSTNMTHMMEYLKRKIETKDKRYRNPLGSIEISHADVNMLMTLQPRTQEWKIYQTIRPNTAIQKIVLSNWRGGYPIWVFDQMSKWFPNLNTLYIKRIQSHDDPRFWTEPPQLVMLAPCSQVADFITKSQIKHLKLHKSIHNQSNPYIEKHFCDYLESIPQDIHLRSVEIIETGTDYCPPEMYQNDDTGDDRFDVTRLLYSFSVCPSLQSIDIRFSHYMPGIIHSLPKFKFLQHLSLSQIELGPESAENLSHFLQNSCPKLESLSLVLLMPQDYCELLQLLSRGLQKNSHIRYLNVQFIFPTSCGDVSTALRVACASVVRNTRAKSVVLPCINVVRDFHIEDITALIEALKENRCIEKLELPSEHESSCDASVVACLRMRDLLCKVHRYHASLGWNAKSRCHDDFYYKLCSQQHDLNAIYTLVSLEPSRWVPHFQ